MIKRILNSQSKTITFAAALLAFSALISRLLGFFRDRLLAGRFGAGEELDIYFVAFRIPDFIYGILVLGGISAIFLPIFSEYFKKKEDEAWEFANNLLNSFLVLLIILCGLLAIFTPWIINLIAPGFSGESRNMAITLSRIMFLSPIFFGLSSIFSGVLHYFNRFLIYSLAPVLYNLGIIIGILFFVPRFGLYGLAYGVIFGAALHWLIQIPATIHSGFKYRFVLNFKYPGILKAFKLLVPRTIGSAAHQINLIVVTAIASTLAIGSITIFNFSNNLRSFPIGLIGISFAIASFPALSRAWADNISEKFLEIFTSAFRQILFLVVPISFLTFLLRAQIVRIVLGTGEFGWLETRLTAASLGIFCIGIFASAFIPFLARTFYSFQDTKTPVLIGLKAMSLNIVLCFLFVYLLKYNDIFREFMVSILRLQGIEDISVIGLPLALSLSGIVYFSLLLRSLKNKIKGLVFGEILQSFKKVILATIFSGVATYFTIYLIANLVDPRTFLGIFIQAGVAAVVGIIVYLLVTFFLKSPELRTIKNSILEQFKRNDT